MTNKDNKDRANNFIEYITSNSDYRIVLPALIDEEFKFFKKIKKKISYTDILLIYLAEKYRATIFSFDKQLLKVSKQMRR